jgi:hypothetical protein
VGSVVVVVVVHSYNILASQIQNSRFALNHTVRFRVEERESGEEQHWVVCVCQQKSGVQPTHTDSK